MTMHLTTEDLDQIEEYLDEIGSHDVGTYIDQFQAEHLFKYAGRLSREVRRLRGLADDDTAVERAAKAVACYCGVDWGDNAHSASSQKVYRGIACAALRAALGQEDA